MSDSSIDNSNGESGDIDAKLETVGRDSELAVIFSKSAGVSGRRRKRLELGV